MKGGMLRDSLWKQVKSLMDHSLFFRAVDALLAFFQRIFSASVLAKFFTGVINDEVYDASVFVRFVRAVPGLFVNMRRSWFKTAYDNSGWSLMMSNLGALAQGSAAARFVSGFIGLDLEKPRKQSWFPLALMGIGAVGAVAAFIIIPSKLYAAAGVAGVIGALAALAYPELGVLCVTAAAPFLPTMVLAAILGYTALCYFFKLLTDSGYTPYIDATGLMVVVYAVVGLFYGVTSFHPSSSVRVALLTALITLSYLLTTALINSKRKLNALLFTFCTSAAVTGLVGAYQKFSGKMDMTWVDKELFSDLTLRVYSTFANPNVYGSYLLLAIPVCLIMVHMSNRWLYKLYYLLISALLLYNLGYTYSRGCYLALGAGLIIYILFTEKRLITLFSAGIVVLPFIAPASMLNRFSSITNLSDSSTSYRIYIWQATLRILKDFWISGLGQGIEAYNAVYPYYAFSDVTAPHSHNLFLQVFTELGIFGLIVFLVLLLTFFRTLLRLFYKTRNNKTKSFLAGFFAAGAAFLMQGMFDYVFYNYRVMLTFFIFMGMGCAMVNIRLKEDFC
ncbi:MAG: O-antigen ligase family protein [Clostridiales bacterium]|jgi:O-antigen ligase|nr:O-antigen ligase family protein [Clostridiales bacterium]